MTDDSVRLGELAEELTASVRAGAMPQIEDYVARHPELAGRIRELFPALMFLEGIAAGNVHGEAGPAELGPGSTFGGYRVERELGRGGMGVVYEAIHLGLGKRVALKVLPLANAGGAGHLERFLREARTAAGLHHTNIVPVFDVGQVGGLPYYAMQLIDGRGLDRVLGDSAIPPTVPFSLADSPPLADSAPPSISHPAAQARYFRWVAGLGIQAAEALAHAHERGVVHRDIKPSNLLLDARGVLWVTDFGLARSTADPALTHSGVLLGTPRYMSPEQAEAARKPVDHRTDVYSLGATLYELLTHRPAFDGRTPQEVVSQIVAREPVPPRRLNRAVPRDLETIILKAMAKRPQDRYATARQLADDLGCWLRTEPIRARRVGPIGRTVRWCRRNPRLAAVTAIATVVILLLTSLYYASLLRALGREKDARADAEASARESRRRLTRHYVDNGVRVMDDGDLLGSLPWFAEALRLDQDDPERARTHRARLGAVLHCCPKLVQVWSHDGGVSVVAFRPDGGVVLTAGDDRTARTWDARTGKPLLALPHPRPVLAALFSPDGGRIITSCAHPDDAQYSREVRLWDAATGRPIGNTPRHEDYPSHLLRLSPDGLRLLTVEIVPRKQTPVLQRLHLYDATTGQHVAALEGQYEGQLSSEFSLDGRRLLMRTGDNRYIRALERLRGLLLGMGVSGAG